MKIPKYIDKLIDKRAASALAFTDYDSQLVKWLGKNGIVVSNDHILAGACSLIEPYGSAKYIKDCIRDA